MPAQYLFDRWKKLRAAVLGKPLFLFLDFDGTLSPIVPVPEKAKISCAARRLLAALSGLPSCRVAVISGRSLRDLKAKVGVQGIFYSGNHGLELEGPGLRDRPVGARYRRGLDRIKKELERIAAGFKGARVEDKGLSLSLHFRQVRQSEYPRLKSQFRAALLPAAEGLVRIVPGKKVLDVRPRVDVDKGTAVLRLLKLRGPGGRAWHPFPVYVGDDVVDEDAFRALKGKGIGIVVGRPRHSAAEYYVKNTGEVIRLLKEIHATR